MNKCEHRRDKMTYDPDVDNYWCYKCRAWLFDKPDVIQMPDGEWIPNYEKQAWVFVSRADLPQNWKQLVDSWKR